MLSLIIQRKELQVMNSTAAILVASREKRILSVDSVLRTLFNENEYSEYNPQSSSASEGFTSGNLPEEDLGPGHRKENRTCDVSPMAGQDDSSSLSDS